MERKTFRIDEILGFRDLNMSQLAQKVGVSRTNLYNYLSENNNTIVVLNKIANALGVSVSDLFPRSNKKVVGLLYFNNEMFYVENLNDIEFVRRELYDYFNEEIDEDDTI